MYGCDYVIHQDVAIKRRGRLEGLEGNSGASSSNSLRAKMFCAPVCPTGGWETLID